MDQRLKQYLKYDSITGNLTWIKSNSNRTPVGTPIQCKDHAGYILVRLFGILYKAHRVAWFLHYNKEPMNFIDHINGNTSDNRIVNLRVVDALENAHNHKIANTNTSGKCGVSFCNYYKKWVSYIDINNKRKNLGYSKTLELAIQKRKDAELKYYGYAVRG